MELLLSFLITFWRTAVFCIAFASTEFCNSEILTSLKYLLIQQRWLLLFVAGRDSQTTTSRCPRDCGLPWAVMGRENRELDALESKYRVKVPIWAVLHFEGKSSNQTDFCLITKTQSKAPWKANRFVNVSITWLISIVKKVNPCWYICLMWNSRH